VGTVGAGKSTQMRLLSSVLKKRGIRVKVTFLKTGHLLSFILEIVLVKILVSGGQRLFPIRILIEQKPNIFKKMFKLWLILDMVSIYVRFLFTIYLPIKMRRIVLVEEYIPAIVADHVYLAKSVGLPLTSVSFLESFILKLLHIETLHIIFLDASDASLKERWRYRASLDEVPNYLQMQRTLLPNISKKLSSSFFYIETSGKTIKETHKLIVNHVNEILH
jgi:thymidylate kinase